MSATQRLAEYVNTCVPPRDPTLTDSVPGCGEWRINQGRYNPIWQMPPSPGDYPDKLPRVYAFTLRNEGPRPLKLYYLQAGAWRASNLPVLQPGDDGVCGNVYLAYNRMYRALDASTLAVIAEFQVNRDGGTVTIR